ncbi:hypothetical protein M501DRAFT_282745 [Patellaria atrata CBS 101060]|uniref:Uncharacterized protein n=1 Tax=Patellaria atrata CBS 101060 TaxID=1346257 RepID=A0A9P4S6G1_9PEZI|nr:hypothetical protein M501DRAFT_282745 [Patellaria atrata CBS 101060]
MLTMGLLCLIYLICALRTNIVFVGIFATLLAAFCLLAGAYWQVSNVMRNYRRLSLLLLVHVHLLHAHLSGEYLRQ